MDIVDRTLSRIEFRAVGVWIHCYLHEDSLQEPRFTVVEGAPEIRTIVQGYDDLQEAMKVYEGAATRTKERILSILK